jgi:hypothetical protein
VVASIVLMLPLSAAGMGIISKESRQEGDDLFHHNKWF